MNTSDATRTGAAGAAGQSEPIAVLVTGGGAGIGRAAAVWFAREGARAVVTGRRAEPLQALALQEPGIDSVVADSAWPGDAARTVATMLDRLGRLDVVVNNAAAGAILPLAQADAKRIVETFAVNVVGHSLLVSAALDALKASKGCAINISSTFGHEAAAMPSHYAGSKAALEHMTRRWALELAPYGPSQRHRRGADRDGFPRRADAAVATTGPGGEGRRDAPESPGPSRRAKRRRHLDRGGRVTCGCMAHGPGRHRRWRPRCHLMAAPPDGVAGRGPAWVRHFAVLPGSSVARYTGWKYQCRRPVRYMEPLSSPFIAATTSRSRRNSAVTCARDLPLRK